MKVDPENTYREKGSTIRLNTIDGSVSNSSSLQHLCDQVDYERLMSGELQKLVELEDASIGVRTLIETMKRQHVQNFAL